MPEESSAVTHTQILEAIGGVRTDVGHVAGRLDEHIRSTNAWRERFDTAVGDIERRTLTTAGEVRRLTPDATKAPRQGGWPGVADSLIELFARQPLLSIVVLIGAAIFGAAGVSQVVEAIAKAVN